MISWELRASAPDHLSEKVVLQVPQGGSVPRDFALAPVPPILLVDDDDNGPDVRDRYTAALDALGADYFLWDTANSDNEPDAAMLEAFDAVIWFTGDEFGGTAGPGSAGESSLAGWLEPRISTRRTWRSGGRSSTSAPAAGVAPRTAPSASTTR